MYLRSNCCAYVFSDALGGGFNRRAVYVLRLLVSECSLACYALCKKIGERLPFTLAAERYVFVARPLLYDIIAASKNRKGRIL